MKRWVAAGGAAALFVTVLLVSAWPRATSKPPNVVLIVMCSVRADQLALNGADVDPMPWLTQRGQEGLWFEDAWTAAPWTRPATAAVLTGQDTLSLGIADPAIEHNRRILRDDARTLAERLHDAGYWAVGRSGNPNVSTAYGFDQGFDDLQYVSATSTDVPVKTDGALLIDGLLTGLDQAPDDVPRFVFALFVDAHTPLDASVADAAPFLTGDEPRRVARYRAELQRLDSHLITLERGLAERGLTPDNTVFAVVSDHGEGLSYPAHHGRSHGFLLFPSVTRMVWALWGPDVPTSTRVSSVASQVDVLPTLLDVIGLSVPTDVDGVSQVPSWEHADEPPPRTTAFSATLFHGVRRAAATTADSACLASFRDDSGQLHTGRQGGVPFEPGCFDRTTDSSYRHPVLRPELMAELRAWWRPPVDAPSLQPDDHLGEALRALGYAE